MRLSQDTIIFGPAPDHRRYKLGERVYMRTDEAPWATIAIERVEGGWTILTQSGDLAWQQMVAQVNEALAE